MQLLQKMKTIVSRLRAIVCKCLHRVALCEHYASPSVHQTVVVHTQREPQPQVARRWATSIEPVGILQIVFDPACGHGYSLAFPETTASRRIITLLTTSSPCARRVRRSEINSESVMSASRANLR